MSFIEVSGLSRTYKTVIKKKGVAGSFRNLIKPEFKTIYAVKDIDIKIESGECVGFIGPNGAGKSTTVKMLSGILAPSSGSITVNGYIPYKQRKKFTATIGVVFGQRTQLWWDLPVSDTFELLKYVYKIDQKTYDKNMEIFNDILGLAGFVDQPVRQLSLGQRMRADLASALLHNPTCLFLDEPTIGLDVIAKENIRNFIKTVNAEKGTTILFTSHDMVDLEKTCKRILIIDKGALIYDGTIGRIKEMYGQERALVVDFRENYPALDIQGVRIADDSGFKKTITFNRDKTNISDLIGDITKKYSVADLTVKEPEIDDIIREIYLNGMQKS